MASLRARYEHWKTRRSPSPASTTQFISQKSLNQCAPVPQHASSQTLPTKELCEPSYRTSTRHDSQSNAPDHAGWSVELWRQALEAVKSRPDWEECCKIVKRETGAQLNQLDGRGDPLQQIAEISLHANQFAERKAQATNKGLQAALDGTIHTLQVVKDLGAAAVAFNPYAALGWNVIQFIISVASTNHAVQKEACESLSQVVKWTARYQTWVGVYSETSTIQILKPQYEETLIDIFTAIINYEVAVVITLRSKMTRIKTAFSGEASSRTRQALADLTLKQEQWRNLEPAVAREISNSQFKEVGNSIEKLRKASDTIADELRAVSSNVDSQRRAQVLDWVSPVRSDDEHQEQKRQSLAHTTDWLMNHKDYVSWNGNPASNYLWLKGKPGCGKSVLVNAVINDQLANCNTDQEAHQVLFFYCDGTDAERQAQIDSHEKILRSLVKQLCGSSSNLLPDSLLAIYENQHHRRSLTGDQCLDLLLSLSDSSVDLVIIVDGVDECTPVVQRNLVRSLHFLASHRGRKLRLLLACRPTVALEHLFHDLAPCTINVPDHTESAIRLMVESIVHESQRSPDLKFLYRIGSRDLAPKVIEKVTRRAGGMFRFVQITLDRLNRSRNPHLLEQRLEELNSIREMNSLYDVVWGDVMADQSEVEQQLIITALNFLIYCFPYSIRENVKDRAPIRNDQHILEACTFLLKENLDEAFSIPDLVAMCPSFLDTSRRVSGDGGTWSNVDLTLRIHHFTATEYLVNQHSELFGPAAANAAIATLCMRVFTDMSVSTDFSAHPPNGLALYAVMCWSEHVRLSQSCDEKPASLMSPTLKAFLLDSPCSASFQRWTFLMKKFRQNIVHRCRGPVLRQEDEYLIDVRPKSTNELEEEVLVSVSLVTQPPSSLFARLYLGFGTENIKGPVSHIRATWEFGGGTVTPQTFAATLGLTPAICRLKRMGCSPNEQNDRGETSGHVLFAEGVIAQNRSEGSTPTIFRALVQAGLRLDVKNHAGNSCFFTLLDSARFGGEIIEILEIFREQGFDLDATEPDFYSTIQDIKERPLLSPLEFAVAHMPGQEDRTRALDWLISYHTSQHQDPESLTKWLCLAVNKSDARLVRLLIEKHGADPTQFDDNNLLPLQHTLMKGSGNSIARGAVIDTLTPMTLKPGFRLRSPSGFLNVATYEALLRGCTLPTIKLFVQYTAPVTEKETWGERPITNALLYNREHGRKIAEYLHSGGFTNPSNSRIYRKWLLGETYPDDAIDWNFVLGLAALDEDDIGDGNPEDEYCPRTYASDVRTLTMDELLAMDNT